MLGVGIEKWEWTIGGGSVDNKVFFIRIGLGCDAFDTSRQERFAVASCRYSSQFKVHSNYGVRSHTSMPVIDSFVKPIVTFTKLTSGNFVLVRKATIGQASPGSQARLAYYKIVGMPSINQSPPGVLKELILFNLPKPIGRITLFSHYSFTSIVIHSAS